MLSVSKTLGSDKSYQDLDPNCLQKQSAVVEIRH